MKSPGAWRSVEEWKSALMTLPDSSFFELLRSVFGNIKTPFNKQRLLEDLFNFLSRNEIRKTIAAYIDADDHKIISAVALLGEPAPGDLESFFSGEISCAELQALFLNLEERLILYRFRDERVLRLALNPVLEPVLAPFIADSRRLFPFFEEDSPQEESEKSGNSGTPGKSAKTLRARVSGGRVLAALFALLLNEEEPFRAEGKLRKKLLDAGKKLLPGLDLELAVKILIRLELLRYDGQKFAPRGEKIENFGGLSSAEREEYWAAGVYLCLEEEDRNGGGNAGNGLPAHNGGIREEAAGPGGEFRFSRNRLRETASFIHRFMSLIAPEGNPRKVPGKRYPEITLRRLWKLFEKENDEMGHVWGAALFDNRARLSFEPFLAALETAGLLEHTGCCWKSAERPAPEERKDALPAEPVIVTDTAFSFVLLPEISFADALALAAFCSLKENSGTSVCFELTRSSAVQGFDGGVTSARMLELLSRLSGGRLDANLGWTLKEWENRYTGVSLHEGIVLTLAEDRRYLAEAAPVASLIRRTLAPGVYLLSPEDKSEAAKALRKAGVDIIAQPPSVRGGETGRAGFPRNSFPRPGLAAASRPPFFPPRPRGDEPGTKPAFVPEETDSAESAAFIKEKFRRVLEKMNPNNQEREELSARIERRLVLTEAQLEKASLRYEKLEARGLDYVGKAIIAKQAIEAGSMLEISWPGSGGAVNRIAGFPRSLEKKEGESILVLRPASRGEGEAGDSEKEYAGDTVRIQGDTIRVPLGKISLLRRIKQSIFGG